MKLLINAFLLTIILFVSISLSNYLLMWLYLGLQMSRASGSGLNLIGESLATMDKFGIPSSYGDQYGTASYTGII